MYIKKFIICDPIHQKSRRHIFFGRKKWRKKKRKLKKRKRNWLKSLEKILVISGFYHERADVNFLLGKLDDVSFSDEFDEKRLDSFIEVKLDS